MPKHPQWGSIKPKPKRSGVVQNQQFPISTGELTYWPTDRRQLFDLLTTGITKGVTLNSLQEESCLDLSSDHYIIIIPNVPPPTLSSKRQTGRTTEN